MNALDEMTPLMSTFLEAYVIMEMLLICCYTCLLGLGIYIGLLY